MEDLDLGLNIGFDTEFQALLENTSGTASHSNQQDLSASSSTGCSKCSQYRKDIQQMEKEHRVNFLFLKKKVISTDMLIKRFKSKQDDILSISNILLLISADNYAKTVLTLKQQLDNANRDSNILSEQLKSAMESIKPLRENKEVLESALREKSGAVAHLTDRLHAEEALRNQRSSVAQRNQELEREKQELDKKIKSLETRNKSMQSNIKGLESEYSIFVLNEKSDNGSLHVLDFFKV
ncbi:hypothetical protein RRG08_024662 [Elysia crispata]|uniref:Uncharacterized protein n=1 Tax=Elysia crispata TaxID=231223 RepID=A0AAE0ZXR8_9GAST|nr:hypothetical protein RRG08_024662 [Elysia crispata]